MLTPGSPRASWSNLLASTPVQVAGVASSATAVENIRSANFVHGTAGAGALGAGNLIWDNVSGTWQKLTSAFSIADTVVLDGQVAAGLWAYNGSTWDRVRNNQEVVLLASAVRSVNTVTAQQTNYNARGVMLCLSVTANPGGAESLSVQVRALGLAGARTIAGFPLIPAATNGVYIDFLYPGGVETIAAAGVEVQGLPLPRFWDVAVTPTAGGNWTYALNAYLIR